MMEAKIKAVPNRISEKAKAVVPEILSMALWFVLSFASSGAFLFGKLAPFGISSVAAAKKRDAFAAALGAISGYIFSGGTENKLRYIAAVIAVLGAKLIVERITCGDIAAVFIAGGSMAVTGFGYAAISTISGYGAVMALSETVLASGAAYFFKRTGSAFEDGKVFSSLSNGDKACIIVTAAIASASLMSVKFGRISLGEIAACFIVLMAARYIGVSGGSIAGIATGIAVALSSTSMDGILSGYAVGGLMSGMFGPFGKICSGAVFVIVRLMFCFVSAGEYMELSPFYEAVIAFTVFLLIPEKFSKTFVGAALYDERLADSATVKELVLSKMGYSAAALNDISEMTKKVLISVEHENTTGMSTILNSAAGKYCASCSKSSDCWKEHYPETVKEFSEMGIAARKSRNTKFSEEFKKRCNRSGELDDEIKAEYKDAARKNSEERKLKDIRGVVAEQFDGLALLLRDIAGEVASIKNTDKKLSAAVKGVFEERNIPVFAAVCYYSVDDCVNVEVSMAKERAKNIDIVSITEELSDLCGCDFSIPAKRETENAVRMFFVEQPLIEAEFGETSINALGEKFCGDSSERFIDQSGHANMILSDGMGSGDYAALDSMMTAGLIAKLVKAGFRFGSAIKLVNSALLIKSENESLATVDAVSMNLYTGRADFYKSGAAPSFIIKKGRASKIEAVSMPIGIMGGAEYEQNSVILGAGDIVLLLSDGVTASGEDWIMSELRCLSEKSAKEISKGIAETAYKRRSDGHTDDITVMAMKLNKSE